MARFGLEDLLLGGGAPAPAPAPAVGDSGVAFGRSGFGYPSTNIPYGFAGAAAGGLGARPSVAPSTARPVRGMKLSAADLRDALQQLSARLAKSKPGPAGFGRAQDWQAAQLQGALQQRDPTAESFVAGLQQQDPQTLAFVKGIQDQDPATLRFIAMLQGRRA